MFTFTFSVTVAEDRDQHLVMGSYDSSNMHGYLNDFYNKTSLRTKIKLGWYQKDCVAAPNVRAYALTCSFEQPAFSH